MVAKLAGPGCEDDARLIRHQRRQRILAAARRFERVAAFDLAALQIARLAGHAELVFGAIVERLQIRVGQRPVDERRILRDRRRSVAINGLRPRAEIVLVKAPGDCAVVHGTAARLVAVIENRERIRARLRVRPPGDRLALRVRAQVLSLEVAQFIERAEVRSGQARPALQPNNLHACFAQLGRENPPCGAHTDDDDIGFFGGHRSCLPRRALTLRLQADHGCARERLPILQIRRREHRLRAGEAHQTPAREVLVAAVDRVGKHAFHGVRADGVEKHLRCGPRESGGLALLERRNHFVLPRGIQPDERLVIGLATIRIELSEPAPVEILKIGVGAGERQVDVIEHPRIARTRLVGRAGHEPLGERGNRGGIFVVEERAVLDDIRVRLGRRGRARFRALLVSLRKRAGH